MKNFLCIVLQILVIFFVLNLIPLLSYSQEKVSMPLDEQEQRSVKIHGIYGADSNLKIKMFLENLSKKEILFEVPSGLAFLPASEKVQRMITVHDQSFEIPATEKVSFEVNALCVEAHKQPPSFENGDELSMAVSLENDSLIQFLKALDEIEMAISKSIYGFFGPKIQFRKEASEELIELAQYSHFLVDENAVLHAQIDEQIVQCALWQITDKVTFKDYLKILNVKKEKAELEKVAELAQILLSFAGFQPTIVMRKLPQLKL